MSKDSYMLTIKPLDGFEANAGYEWDVWVNSEWHAGGTGASPFRGIDYIAEIVEDRED